jgi:WD40 repeat protein/serine/threonine protein kinase
MAGFLFLSYAAEDRAYVERLARRLDQELGIQSWWFQGKQEPGVPYKQEIIRRIGDCVAVVVILSRASATSSGVLAEIDYAQVLNKRVIPIVIGQDPNSPSLTEHVRSGVVTYSVRQLDLIDGNDDAEVVPRLQRFLGGPVAGSGGSIPPPEEPRRPTLLTGYTIKGYKIGQPVAQTNSSVVYQAREQAVARDVAVKVVLPALTDQEAYRRRFEEEARRVAALEHGQIVPLYNYWSEDSDSFLVMRWMGGGSLVRLMFGPPLGARQISRLFAQIVSGLGFAHAHGVIHRDIKPANILLDQAGNAYLSDFGIAGDAMQTRGGAASLGYTPGYAPPEQVAGHPATAQADVYAMGVLLYELVSGSRAFPGVTATESIQRQFQGPLPTLGAWAARAARPMPARLDEAVARAMAHDADDRFATLAEFADEVRPGLMELLRAEGLDEYEAQSVVQPVETPGLANPYKALRPFDEGDAADFFGRQALSKALDARLRGEGPDGHFLAVVGASGSGKSSVVRAGLVPAFRRRTGCLTAVLTPGDQPLERVADALGSASGVDARELLVLLYSNEDGLRRAAERALPADANAELLLVIDQFEELYTLVADPVLRQYLLTSLTIAASDPRSRLRVVITLRADFYDRPLSDPMFSRLMDGRTETVMPLSKAELEEAIVRPAARVGTRVEPSLVREIIADVEAQPGALPLLQYALHALYERCAGGSMTLRAYQGAGGLRGALERQADEAMTGLTPPQRALARQIFLRLVTPGDGVQDTRRRVRQSELIALLDGAAGSATGGATLADLQLLLARFGEKRLLAFDREPGTREPTVEVAHEALIQSWAELRTWLGEARVGLRVQRRLSEAASDWQRQGRNAQYLASGGPLGEFEALAGEGVLALNADERAFIAASAVLRERQLASEQEQQARALAQAQALAEEQRRRADEKAASETRLRRQAASLRGLLVGALALLLLAGALAYLAFDRSQVASRSAAQAQANAAQAQTAEANAEARQAEAEEAQADAERNTVSQVAGDIAALQVDLGILLSHEVDGLAAEAGESDSGLLGAMLNQPRLAGYLRGHMEPVNTAAFSPDGRLLASGGDDDMILIWDTDTRQPVRPPLIGHRDDVRDLIFASDTYLISAGDDGRILKWDMTTGTVVGELAVKTEWVNRLAINPQGVLLYTRCELDEAGRCTAGEVRLWDLASAESYPTSFQGHRGRVWDLALSPDGSQLLTAGADNSVRLWDVASGDQIALFDRHAAQVYAVAFSSDGSRAVSGDADGNLIVYDIPNARTVGLPLETDGQAVLSLAYSPSGRVMASAGFGDRVQLWDASQTRPEQIEQPLAAHSAGIDRLAFSPDGTWLVSSSRDHALVLWNMETSALIQPVAEHYATRFTAALNPVEPMLVTGGEEAVVQFLDPQNGDELVEPLAVSDDVTKIAYSPDGNYIAVASEDGNVRVLANAGRNVINTWFKDANEASAVAFSPDSALLAIGYADDYIALVSVDEDGGDFVRSFARSDSSAGIVSLAFSPTGSWLVAGDDDGAAVIWNVESGKLEAAHTEHGTGNALRVVAFSPLENASYVLSGADDGRVIRWNYQTGETVPLPVGGRVFALAFSPDGTLFVTGALSQPVQLWSIDSLAAVGKAMSDHRVLVREVFFLDSATLLTLDERGIVRRWSVPGGDPVGEPLETSAPGTSYSLAFSPDGALLASGGRDERVLLLSSGQEPLVLEDHTNSVLAVAFGSRTALNKDGTVAAGGTVAQGGTLGAADLLATASYDARVLLWDPASGELLRELTDHGESPVHALAFSPVRGMLASADSEGRILYWSDPLSGAAEQLKLNQGAEDAAAHDGTIYSLAFSPDGKWLVSASDDDTLKVWDVAERELYITLRQHGESVFALAFNADGTLLASGAADDRVILWDTQRWEPLGSPLLGHRDSVFALAFGNNGLLASGSGDGEIILWDVAERRPLGAPIQVGETVYGLAFDPKGDRLVFGAWQREVSSILLNRASWRAQACAMAGRNLSADEWQTYMPDRPYRQTCPELQLAYGALLAQADSFARAGEREQAVRTYTAAVEQALAGLSPIFSNKLCWEGSINDFAELVLPACNRAVDLTADEAQRDLQAMVRDTRGVALALSGETEAAIADFEHYLAWTKAQDDDGAMYERYGAKREGWIETLKRGGDPFTPEVLNQLRNE